MTKNEFYYRFNVIADKVASQDAPGYTKREVSQFATQAQTELILTYYNSKERALIGAFEGSEKTKVYLDELVRKEILIPVVDNSLHNGLDNLNSFLVDLPDDCLFNISDWAKNITNNTINIKPVEHDFVEGNLINPYKRPEEWVGMRLMWRLNLARKEGISQIQLIGFGITPVEYHINYIKYPDDIDLTIDTSEEVSELDKIVHWELLLMTVQKAGIATDTELQQFRMNESETTK